MAVRKVPRPDLGGDRVNAGELPPTMHGYIHEHLFMTPREANDIRARMAKVAAHEGWELGSIFIEKVETSPEAFETLVRILMTETRKVFVAVPSVHHFSPLGHPIALKAELERVTGATVVLAGYAP